MSTIEEGTVAVLTFKDGLLSRLGHDLRLEAERFEITYDLEARSVTARVFATSLAVRGAVRSDGSVDAGALSAKDQREILESTRSKVLRSARHPEIVFEGQLEDDAGSETRAHGQLRMAGASRQLTVALRRSNGRLLSRITLTPSEWGIKPFSALLGTLRIQDRVEVLLDLPDPIEAR